MKHIGIYQSLSGLTEAVKNQKISDAYVVKIESDDSIRYASESGLYIVFSGETERRYLVVDGGYSSANGDTYSYYVNDPVNSDYHAFRLYQDGTIFTAGTYYHFGDGYAACGGDPVESESDYGDETAHTVSLFETHLPIKIISYQPAPWYLASGYGPGHVFVKVGYSSPEGEYEEGTEEWCNCGNGEWDYEENRCKTWDELRQECEEGGGCWDDETYTCGECGVDCNDWENLGYESYEDCTCQNYEEGCPEDPECECNNTDGYHFWDGETCHDCNEEWEELGYSSAEECACEHRGEDSGVCQEPEEE